MLRPGLFADMAGAVVSGEITAEEFKKQTGLDCSVDFGNEKRALTSKLHKLTLRGAEKLADFSGGKLSGLPAVTVNSYGKGKCILYACDGNDIFFYEALARIVGEQCGVVPLVSSVDDGILLASRENDNGRYLFAINMKESEQSFVLDSTGTELLSGKSISGRITLHAYETAVIKK